MSYSPYTDMEWARKGTLSRHIADLITMPMLSRQDRLFFGTILIYRGINRLRIVSQPALASASRSYSQGHGNRRSAVALGIL